MAWAIWIVVWTALTLVDKRLGLVGAIIFGIGLGLGWW